MHMLKKRKPDLEAAAATPAHCFASEVEDYRRSNLQYSVVASSSGMASIVASRSSLASAVASSSGNKSVDSAEAAEQGLILGEAIYSPEDAQGKMEYSFSVGPGDVVKLTNVDKYPPHGFGQYPDQNNKLDDFTN